MDSWSDRPIKLAPLVFFDLETTGIRPDRRGHIVEIAVVDTDAVLHAWATDRGSPRDEIVARQCRILYDLFADRVVVDHNLSFDFGFLAHEADRLESRAPELRYVDTLALSRRLLDADDVRLDTLADRFDLVPDDTLHTALGDARDVRSVYKSVPPYGRHARSPTRTRSRSIARRQGTHPRRDRWFSSRKRREALPERRNI